MVNDAVLQSISPPVPSDPPPFRLVRRSAVLRRLPVTNPMTPEIRGDVAEIAGLGLVAQWELAEADGSITTYYNRLPADADLDYVYRPGRLLPLKPGQFTSAVEGESPDHNLTLGATPVNPFKEIADAVEMTIPRGWYEVDMTDRGDRELKRFVDEFPALAERFGVSVPPPPVRLFELGRVRRSPLIPPGVDIDWQMYVEFHAAGQWGEHGAHDPDFELTAAQRFSVGLQPTNVQNHVSLATGSGPIRSRWKLPDDQQALMPKWYDRPRVGFVEVLTARSRHRGPETIVRLQLETAG